ncbi:MAG TPA: type II secretion system F family protein [Candidatus Paceibacterota bacterium]
MSHFIYKAKKLGGQIYKGEKDAKDRYELYKMIKESGEEIVSVEEKKKFTFFKNIDIPFLNSVKSQDKINFARNLGSMISAGLSMSRALSVMERQGKKKNVKAIIATLNSEINKGKTLSESMSMFRKMFSPLFISMVKSGEESGNLAESLNTVAMQMDKNYALQRKIRGALMYPGVILFAMIIIAIILLTYVVPNLMKTFSELNVALPLSTRIILWFSDSMQNHGLLILLGLIIISTLYYLWAKSKSGKSLIHKLILKIPIIGALIIEVNSARTARTLSSLVTSGVDVLESLRITSEVVQNVHYKNVLTDAVSHVEKGEPLSKVFIDNKHLYPIFFGEMLNVGEETGKISEMLTGVAVYYEDDVDQKTKDMSTIIEPFLMIIIAAAVGFFAIAMISPMYSLVDVI